MTDQPRMPFGGFAPRRSQHQSSQIQLQNERNKNVIQAREIKKLNQELLNQRYIIYLYDFYEHIIYVYYESAITSI